MSFIGLSVLSSAFQIFLDRSVRTVVHRTKTHAINPLVACGRELSRCFIQFKPYNSQIKVSVIIDPDYWWKHGGVTFVGWFCNLVLTYWWKSQNCWSASVGSQCVFPAIWTAAERENKVQSIFCRAFYNLQNNTLIIFYVFVLQFDWI